jgi:hypothetical protein
MFCFRLQTIRIPQVQKLYKKLSDSSLFSSVYFAATRIERLNEFDKRNAFRFDFKR